MSAAPVTESHKRLVATIVERAFRFAEGNHKITPELSQLIADSEAKATDQLRAECNNLNNLLRAVGWGQGEIDSAACIEEENEKLRAEAELKEARRIVTEQSNLRLIAEDGLNHVTALKNKIHERYQSDLASKEAELATEREKVRVLQEAIKFSANKDKYLHAQFDPCQRASTALTATEETK